MYREASTPTCRRDRDELRQPSTRAVGAGVRRDAIILDPGLGFAKKARALVSGARRLDGSPRWTGRSSRPVAQVVPEAALGDVPPAERDWGTAAAVTASVLLGAHIVRVHGVSEMVAGRHGSRTHSRAPRSGPRAELVRHPLVESRAHDIDRPQRALPLWKRPEIQDCCGNDEPPVACARRSSTRDSALAKLLTFAFQPAFDSDHTVAEIVFWGNLLRRPVDLRLQWLLDSEDATIKYNSWFLFDWDVDGLRHGRRSLSRRGRRELHAGRARVPRPARQRAPAPLRGRGGRPRHGVHLVDLWTGIACS